MNLENLIQKYAEILRNRVPTTVYVLLLENDRYYVGSTQNPTKRLGQHATKQGGSAWTRQHHPIKCIGAADAPWHKGHPHLRLENRVTLALIERYGHNKVRGGSMILIDPEKNAPRIELAQKLQQRADNDNSTRFPQFQHRNLEENAALESILNQLQRYYENNQD